MTSRTPHLPFSIPVWVLEHGQGLDLPIKGTALSAGFDVSAAIDQPITLKTLDRCLIPTGMIFGIPEGYMIEIAPRSGLAFKNGITVLNTPGIIDADYRGELKILLINLGQDPFVIERGMRIAQLLVRPVAVSTFETADGPITHMGDRSSGGFGSTGLFAPVAATHQEKGSAHGQGNR